MDLFKEQCVEAMDRDEVGHFLNITPGEDSPTWAQLAMGITSYGIDYNPQVKTSKYIHQKNATNLLKSNQKQGAVTQEIYKDDPCFKFIHSLLDKTGKKVITDILDIDWWDTEEGTPIKTKAKKSSITIAITKYMEEEATIQYTVYYNGDPIEGTVTVTNKEITFTEKAA